MELNANGLATAVAVWHNEKILHGQLKLRRDELLSELREVEAQLPQAEQRELDAHKEMFNHVYLLLDDIERKVSGHE